MNHLQDKFPLLISGLPGVPGFNAFFYFQHLYGKAVIGVKPPHTQGMLYPGVQTCDLENPSEVAALFDRYQFRSVLDASGSCALKSCEYNPELAQRVNVGIGLNLLAEAKRRNCRFIRLSSDLVFDGVPYTKNEMLQEGQYTEDWPVSPVTIYGKTMAEAESRILNEYSEAAVLRIPLPMGPSFNGHAGAIDWIESRFKASKPATLYFDEVRSSLYVQDLNRVIEHFIFKTSDFSWDATADDASGKKSALEKPSNENSWSGLFHLGGPSPLSLYATAQVINALGAYSPELLEGCLRKEAGPMPPRAGNVSMNCSKLLALVPSGTIQPWPKASQQRPDHLEWHYKRENRAFHNRVNELLYGYVENEAEKWRHPMVVLENLKLNGKIQTK